ncbi:MAG: trigger factor [Gammaproteobacteria bacterium]|nr:trigger factor [Gammaproteobacteria bacterium]
MQVSLETTGALERKMTIEVPAEKVSSAMQQRLQRMSREVKISGFRPGKVPMRVVTQRFGKQIFQEVVADTMQSTYQEAIQQEKLRPAGSPQIEPLNLEADQDLKYIATFEVYPEINLADISEVEIAIAEVEIAESDINSMLDKLRAPKMKWNEIARKAKKDDQVTIDFKGSIEGEFFEGGSQDDFPIVLGSGSLLPEFEEQLFDVIKDEEKSFEVTFPKDYMQKDLAEKVATFVIKVKKVEAGELPALDEDFVKEFGIEDGNLDALKEQLKSNMSVELEQRKKAFVKGRVMQSLFDTNEFEIPNALVKQEIEALRKQSMNEIKVKDESKLPDSLFEEEAKRRISLGLIIGEIVQKNELQLDSDKVTDQLNMIASSYNQPEEVIQYYRNNVQAMASVESLVMEEQVVDWVLNQAKKTSKSFTFDEFVNKQV